MTVQTLDVNSDIQVQYCVDLATRDDNIRHSVARRGLGRLCPPVDPKERGDEPIAVVCYGPSLNETWEQIKDYKYSISCSGAHGFLTRRGITPTWHCEVDPRPHKVELIGQPTYYTEYLVASTCHPKVFDHLDGYNVKLWHVFATEEEGFRLLPHGEWALMGGSSVGLRAMAIARHLGFTNQHIFGMDGNQRAEYGKHAAAHPSQPKGHVLTEYGGRTWETTPSLLACAKQTFHELNQMYDVQATFHGDGLVQAMAKDYVRQPVAPEKALIGVCKPQLISDSYRDLNAQLHRENAAYGVGGAKHADTVNKLVRSLIDGQAKAGKPISIPSVLDYGCGRGRLARALDYPIWEYDPAIPGKQDSPRPADVVVCSDVLEHIEPERMDYVLKDLQRVTKQVGYYVIHTGPARKTLPDGRNTHLSQHDEVWWREKLSQYFSVPANGIIKRGPELYCVVGPKYKVKGKAA